MTAYVEAGLVSVGDTIILEAKHSMTNEVIAVVSASKVTRVEPSKFHKYEKMDEIEF